MLTRVGIVDAAQFCGAESKDNFYDQAYSLTKELLDKAGISREELRYDRISCVRRVSRGHQLRKRLLLGIRGLFS